MVKNDDDDDDCDVCFMFYIRMYLTNLVGKYAKLVEKCPHHIEKCPDIESYRKCPHHIEKC